MSCIANRQTQKEISDVNNYWQWPKESTIFQASANTKFRPMFWKWTRWNSSGGFHNKLDIEFNDNSICCSFYAWYFVATFINVQPGLYVIEFDSDQSCIVRMGKYLKLEDGLVLYKNASTQIQTTNAGHVAFEFKLDDEETAMFSIGRNTGTSGYAVITDIKIREGAL